MQCANDVYRKSNFITDDLRHKIVRGEYSPGEKLPTRLQLVAEYGVSKATIQHALSKLMHEGIVESRVGRGTIVSLKSPHITKYALLFPRSQ